MTNEPVPLFSIQEAVLEYVRDREDALIFGAQAVNAYVEEPRMSQDVDIMALNAEVFTEELRSHLSARFQIALRVREVASGLGYRIYQLRKPKNRHLVDVRQVDQLPSHQRLEGILVPRPEELISQKIISMVSRTKTAKGMTDVADLRRLLLTFPELKMEQGKVRESLHAAGVGELVIQAWNEMVALDIEPEDDDQY